MGTADDLYAEGERLYNAGQYAAAEHTFRQLLGVVPQSHGIAYGRAAYSVAVSLIKQGRNDEARQLLDVSLQADPTLDRARRQLDQLNQQFPARLPAPVTRGGVVGIARTVRVGSEHAQWLGPASRTAVLTFRLEIAAAAGGTSAAPTIELRGQHVTGLLDNGDIIELPGGWKPGQQPRRVLNRTTGEWIQGRTTIGRTLMYIILIGFLVAFAIFAVWVFTNMQDGDFLPFTIPDINFPGGIVSPLMTEALTATGW